MGSSSPPLECERHQESKAALTALGASLNGRIRALEQRNEELEAAATELEEQRDELQKEKTQLAAQVETLDASLREKREQLWDTIQDFRDEMKEKKQELQEADERQAEYRRVEAALREEMGSLQSDVRDQKERLLRARAEFNEKEAVTNEKQACLKETVEQLERRLKEKHAEIGALQMMLRDQKTSFSRATLQFNEKTSKAAAKKARLKERVGQLETQVSRLEQRLVAQGKAFEEERVSLKQKVARCQNDAEEKLQLSLDEAMPQLRSLLSAYDRVRGSQFGKTAHGKAALSTSKMGQATNHDIMQRLKEQEETFDQERAQILEQASNAAKTQRDVILQSLMEREGLLTCPLSLELFEFPVLAGCCGKTFSSEALRQRASQSPLCPLCRERLVSTHANRDMTRLVEHHRRERSLLGIPVVEESTSTISSQSNDYAVLSTTAQIGRHSRQRNEATSTRQTRIRDNRNERVIARLEVPHRESSIQRNALPDATSNAASPSSTAAAAPTASNNQQTSPSGVSVWKVGSDGPIAVPKHMVRSVLGTLRFPSAQSRSTASSRRRTRTSVESQSTISSRQRARTRATASRHRSRSSVPSQFTTSSRQRSRSRATAASAASLTSSPVTMSTAAAQQPEGSSSLSATSSPNAASSNRMRTSLSSPSSSSSTAQSTPVAADPINAPSIGGRFANMQPAATKDALHSFISPAANGSQSLQSSMTSEASNNGDEPRLLKDERMKKKNAPSSEVAPPFTKITTRLSRSRAASATARSYRTGRTTASSTPTSTKAKSRRPTRISATQDDSALGRVKRESPRLTASQPAPRQSLSSIARSITTLEDLLGSDFESISDSG
ncbi:unnamed protein product [Phytophthora fragariaefolia]|uniref:Unnamed protein product n=1 Tax=Phytophthora fragariaefolia TaxID=1490495 RepID=A0A9W7D4W8_9STRA|nr:unnamed protein product [Phytophthora fragariaefolia]